MSRKTQLMKNLCIIALLALPILIISIYFADLLFNYFYHSILNLKEWARCLIFSLIGITFCPLPPPSKRKVIMIHKTLISQIRNFLRQRKSDELCIKENFEITLIKHYNFEDLAFDLPHSSLHHKQGSNSACQSVLASINHVKMRARPSTKRQSIDFPILRSSFYFLDTRIYCSLYPLFFQSGGDP
ncbi:MAG: hypothetical protein ACTSQI_07840 [Candidatus Helarchaeota archaeon]